MLLRAKAATGHFVFASLSAEYPPTFPRERLFDYPGLDTVSDMSVPQQTSVAGAGPCQIDTRSGRTPRASRDNVRDDLTSYGASIVKPPGPPATSESSTECLRYIEKTQRRLWALVLILFALMGVGIFVMYAAFTAGEQFTYDIAAGEQLNPDIAGSTNLLVSYFAVGFTFPVTVVLCCLYLREKLAQIQNRSRELVDALEANARILGIRNSQLDTWEMLSHQSITELNLPQLLDLIVKTASKVTESDCAAAIVAEPGSPHLRVAAIHRRGMQTELARRVASTVIATGMPMHLTPARIPPELDRPDLTWDGVAALAAWPLMTPEGASRMTVANIEDAPIQEDGVIQGHRKATGCLLVGRLDPAEPYQPSALTVLGSFANQASAALEKARLYADSQRQLQRLSQLLDQLRSTRSESQS